MSEEIKTYADDGELWSWVRRVMSQGGTIHQDHQHKTYEQYSARLDAAAAERAEELAAKVAGNVRLLSSGQVSRRTDVSVCAMDDAIVAAINAAKDAGVPQGLIVGLLHGHAHNETAVLVNGS
jgi:hypothetical protein